MPIYTYYCPMCGEMDINQSMRESSLEHCPQCGNGGIVKRFHSVGVKFNGSGFYSTDNRGK